MALIEIQYVIRLDEGRCDACRECLPACSYGGLVHVPGEKEPMVDPWACTGCGTCITVCPCEALHLMVRE